jgi:hypothetical protein
MRSMEQIEQKFVENISLAADAINEVISEEKDSLIKVDLANEKLPKLASLVTGKAGESFYEDEPGEPARVREAFIRYVQMGKGRSLQKLAEELSKPEIFEWTNNYESVLRMLKTYSSDFNWQERLRKLITKASTEALAEAQREALTHTKERIRISVAVQRAAMAVIEAAKLDTLSVEEARKLLKPASDLLRLGLSSERAEMGDNLAAIKPDKHPRDMTDEELEELAEALYRNVN